MRCFGNFFDTEYPLTTIEVTRHIVRGLIENDAGQFAFFHLLDHDIFGERNYLETPGGGVEVGESYEQALMREMQEELGVLITTPIPLGYVHDYYHLIKRENYQYYFYAKVKGYTTNNWTDGEKRRFHALHWLSLDAAILWYEQLANKGISRLIKQRELPVLYFLKNQDKFLVSARD